MEALELGRGGVFCWCFVAVSLRTPYIFMLRIAPSKKGKVRLGRTVALI